MLEQEKLSRAPSPHAELQQTVSTQCCWPSGAVAHCSSVMQGVPKARSPWDTVPSRSVDSDGVLLVHAMSTTAIRTRIVPFTPRMTNLLSCWLPAARSP
jgi:hypothetical protein